MTLDRSLWRYEEPFAHVAVSALISRHSTNPRDVRDVVLEGHDLSHANEVLELGCGFGFMATKLAPRLAPEARIAGVDACRENRRLFEDRVRAAGGRRPRFFWMTLDDRLPWDSGTFDLAVASYSLYYFAAIVPEVARVLSPTGRFLVLTHSESSCRELCRLAGVPCDRSHLMRVIRCFSAEQGEEILSRSFAQVNRVEYPNSLRFSADEVGELVAYLRFKFRSMTDWPESEPELSALEARALHEQLTQQDSVTVQKNDTAFWCSQPR